MRDSFVGAMGDGSAVRDGKRDEWQTAHDALVRLALTRAGLDFEEGRWLLAARRSEAHARLGYGSFVEYVQRLFGYAPRLTHEKLRVAEALEGLPELAQTLRDGTTCWSSVRELTRVATAATERAWLEAARGSTAREIEAMVSGHRPGSLPHDPVDGSARRHVLRFEVSGEVLATFREAMAKLRREAGGSLDDDDALLLLARHVLAGSVDDGRASYQVELSVCEQCQRARQGADGELVDVETEIAAMAHCDGQLLGDTHVGNRATTGTDSAKSSASRHHGRARQDVRPAVRRSVLRRDQHRCRVPGCRHATFVDVHHIQPRAEGGGHDADNLVTLCGAHHRATHRGELVIEGRISSDIRFRHADGTAYGGVVSAMDADVQARAFQALRGLGFGEREARAALTRVMIPLDPNLPLESVLRAALQLLTGRLACAC